MKSITNLQHEETTSFRSKLPDLSIPNHLPLHTYCFQNISRFQTRPCLINSATNEVYTYEEVERTSRKVASGLSRIGIQKGETVMLLLPNCPEYVFAFLGTSYIGARSTMANPLFTPAEIIKQATSSYAKLIITQSCHVEKVRGFAMESGTKLMCIDEPPNGDNLCLRFSELTSAADDQGERLMVEIHPHDIVALPYSSGTTGLPKGVMLTHKKLVTNIAQQVDGEQPHLDFHSQDVMMCVLPLFHIYALNCILLAGLRVGAAILLVPKFEIHSFLGLIQRHKVSILQLVPPIVLVIAKMCKAVGQYDLSSVRLLISSAAPLGKEVQDVLRSIIPNALVGQVYGLTESSGPISSTCLAFANETGYQIKSGSCGVLLRNVEVKIVDTESGASLGYNQPGEVLVRGEQVTEGYLNDPESTKRTIDKQGWLHTGDIGFVDAEEDLFIVDRAKEILKYKGFQVAPAELEDILLNHPYISDAAVVAMEDEQAGEVPVAFVVRTNGATITEDDIKQFVSKQVIYYKRLNRVLFTDNIPKSPSGKILRKDLRTMLKVAIPV